MSIIFDIIAISLILACAVSSLKNGFLYTLIKKTAPLISIIAAISGAKKIGANFSGLADKIAPSAAENSVAATVTNPLHQIVEYVIGFVIIFVVSMLILWVLALLFKIFNSIVNKIPVLKIANRVLGVILGLFVGYFNANFFVYIIHFVGMFVDKVAVAISETAVCEFILNHSVFEAVAEKIVSLIA